MGDVIMYFEEKMIDGVLCFRTTPNGEWRPFDIKELSRRYADARGFVTNPGDLSDDGWTYCDDKMPEDGSSVNVTVVSSTTQLRFVLTLDWEDEHWVYEDYNHASFWQPIPDDWKVIAWRRKPDPAKGRDV